MNVMIKPIHVVLGLLLILAVGVYYTLEYTPFDVDFLKKKIGLTDESNKPFEIVDTVTDNTYIFDPSIHNDPRVVENIKGTNIDRFSKKVTILSDKNKFGYFLSNGTKTISGYNYSVDYDQKLVNIYIYRDPTDATKDEFILYFNQAYVGALLAAAEDDKAHTDSTYIPNYETSRSLSRKIKVEINDNNKYFIIYDPN